MVQTTAATKQPHSCQRWAEVDTVLAHDGDDRLGLALPREREDAVRKQLTAYADSLPHHDIADFGQHVRITKVEEFFSYKADLRFLTEQRAVRRQEKPYKGAPVPPAKTTEANIDVWAYRLPIPAAFQKATVEHAVEDSQVVRPCEGCGGQGTAPCNGCSGSKVVACSACRGSGAVTCPQCGGSRQVSKLVRTEQQKKHCDCASNRATARQTGATYWYCKKCNDTGFLLVDVPVYETVSCNCSDGGTWFFADRPSVTVPRGCVACPTCGGHKQVRCPKCGGQGRLTCGKCQGATKLVSSLVVSQTLAPGSVTASAPNAAVEQVVLKQIDEQHDYLPYLQLATTEVSQSVTIKNGSKALQHLLTSAFSKSFEGLPTGGRVARQALTVSRASVLRVGYEYDGHTYVAWLVGSRMRVYAPTSPFSGVVEEKIEEALNLWEQKKRLAAARVLNEAMDLARKDPASGRALEKLLPQLPGLLRFCGQHYGKRVPALVVGSVLAVAVLLVVGILVVNGFRSAAKQRAVAEEEARSVELLGELDPNAPIKVEDVARDFKTAPHAAKKKYDGKTFAVVGPVNNTAWGNTVWIKGGTDPSDRGLAFKFGKQHEAKVSALSKGKAVAIRGTCKVEGKEYLFCDFHNCEFVALPGQEDRSPLLTVAQIVEEYRNDKAAADGKYKGKAIRVSGVVTSTGFASVTLKVNTTSNAGEVECRFDDRKGAGMIRRGSTVTVRGTCDGLADNRLPGAGGKIILKDCELVD